MSWIERSYRRRWSDNNRHFGPLTYSRDDYSRIAAALCSTNDEGDGCHFRLSILRRTLILELPNVIWPHVSWVDTSKYNWAKPKADGRCGYTQIDRCEYGFSCNDGYLNVRYGRQTGDSSTDKSKGYFLPWKSWRFVRHSFYGLVGEHVATLPTNVPSYAKDRSRFERERQIADATPQVIFEFDDYDGERIYATTKIEEREWRLGEGWFRWLSFFVRPKIRRSLDIIFSAETGSRKGSWKGGTIGHSIEMKPGELHESAFKRYCAEHSMKFICLNTPEAVQ